MCGPPSRPTPVKRARFSTRDGLTPRPRLSTSRCVLPEDVAHRGADLAHRAAVLERDADVLDEVVAAARGVAQRIEAARPELVVAIGLERREAREGVGVG